MSLRSQQFLSEISEIQTAGEIIRLKAPVICEWPWENGLALDHGFLVERMRESLTGSNQEPAFVAMVLVRRSES